MLAAASARPAQAVPVHYPDSDGLPMSDNTLQFRWIVTLKENLEVLLPDFVGGNLLWYPIEGDNKTRLAPDVLVAVGRPKGERGSYRQWEEGGVAPQVVFEVLSPGNTLPEMVRKFSLYDRFGVEEYYVYDPDANVLSGYLRRADRLVEIEEIEGWQSPRLGIRFQPGDELVILNPDGRPFLTFQEMFARMTTATQRADEERQRADEERRRADTLAARLRALGVEL